MRPDATLIEVRPMKQADTFDLRRLREGFGADSGGRQNGEGSEK